MTLAHLEAADMPATAKEWFCARYGRLASVPLPTLLRDVAELPDGYRWVGRLWHFGMVPPVSWEAFCERRREAEAQYAESCGSGITAARCGYRQGMRDAVLAAAEALQALGARS